MDAKKQKRRDRIQNLAITLLSVTALLLFSRTELFSLGMRAFGGYMDQLVAYTAPSSNAASPLASAAAPVRVAVTGEYGRYGNITLTTDNTEDFSSLRSLLREVLGSARNFVACTSGDFLSSLDSVGVYYDFLTPLPLSILSELMGASGGEEEILARYLVVVPYGQDAVRLYLWDGEVQYSVCSTAVTVSSLTEVISHYELGNAFFAFESSLPHSDDVAPCSLLPNTLPELPTLTATSALPEEDTLLSALGLNPRNNSRYTESGGTEVIVEGENSLRIYTDGFISYDSTMPELTISAAGAEPTLSEAASGAAALLQTLVGESSGTELYVQEIRQSAGETAIVFGYQVGGVPIVFSDGRPAAEVVLTGSTISSLSLRFRQYAPGTERSLLLPLTQALAVASMNPGKELSIAYVDSAGASVSASWISS